MSIQCDPRYSSRVVYFANDDEQYPWSMGGTAFLASFGESLFVITAQHVVGARDPQQTFVAKTRGARAGIPLNRLLRVPIVDEEHKDIAIFGVQEDVSSIWSVQAFPVDQDSVTRAHDAMAHPQCELMVCGSPREIRGIDYEAPRVREQHANICCRLVRAPKSYARVGALAYPDDLPVTSLAGLSGAPVFAQRPGILWGLAGMIITGDDPRSPGRFIDGVVLSGALNHAVELRHSNAGCN